ncbi:MAG: monovalent cation/H+ antiporter subunit D family protein [Gemmatimonas sp.]|nr:monovalent cation/H+ antiporter subunit D family protein [Gemmatimonas sp.]
MSPVTAVVLAIVVPLVGAVAIGLMGEERANLRETATLVSAAIVFGLVLTLTPQIAGGARPELVLGEPLPGLPIAFEVEPLGLIFSLVASSLWIVTSIYSIGYMRGHHEENQTRFYIFFAIAISAVMGVAFAGNLFTLFVFYEVLTLSTFPLVTHHGTEAAKRGGRVYLGLLLATSIFLFLPAVIWTWYVAGTLDFVPGGILDGVLSPAAATILLGLFVFGIGKAAVMPVHRWLPAAMVAPTPVSALLHAVAVVKAGVFAILKISVYIFGTTFLQDVGASQIFAYVAGATILLASLVAFTKDNLKARLAYSTIGQLSYIVLGAMLANSYGIVGGAMHIVMHAFGKITLFFGAGAILVAAHRTQVSQLDGIGRMMPVTMAAFLIGALSITGLPPTGGTWSKWYLALGTLEAGEPILLAVLMLSSLLNIGYLLVIPARAFFAPADPELLAHPVREAPMPILIAMVITASVSIGLFFFPDPLFDLVRMVVES